MGDEVDAAAHGASPDSGDGDFRLWVGGELHAVAGAEWCADATGFVYTGRDTGVTFRADPEPDGFRVRVPLPRSDAHLAELAAVLGLAEPPAGWAEANARACGRVVSGPVRALPRAQNRAIWTWNRARRSYAERLAAVEEAACGVPRVELLARDGDRSTVLTGVVWSDLLPIAMPEVDVVLVHLSDPSLLGRAGGRSWVVPQVALIPWLARFPQRAACHAFGRGGVAWCCGLSHWLADEASAEPSPELLDALRTHGSERPLVRVPIADVLDRETVTAARGASGCGATPTASHL